MLSIDQKWVTERRCDRLVKNVSEKSHKVQQIHQWFCPKNKKDCLWFPERNIAPKTIFVCLSSETKWKDHSLLATGLYKPHLDHTLFKIHPSISYTVGFKSRNLDHPHQLLFQVCLTSVSWMLCLSACSSKKSNIYLMASGRALPRCTVLNKVSNKSSTNFCSVPWQERTKCKGAGVQCITRGR